MKKTELVFILDRSGSMQGIASDMEGAMKEVISSNKKNEEFVSVTYVRFDDEYEEVFSEKSISEIDGFALNPRGTTALFDAIGKTINSVKSRINSKSDNDKPDQVLFIIITDGLENASKEYKRKDVFSLIEEVKEDGWGVTFIGANQDSIGEGAKIGVTKGSSINYDSSKQGIKRMAKSLTNYVSDFSLDGFASYKNDDSEK